MEKSCDGFFIRKLAMASPAHSLLVIDESTLSLKRLFLMSFHACSSIVINGENSNRFFRRVLHMSSHAHSPLVIDADNSVLNKSVKLALHHKILNQAGWSKQG